MILDFYWQAQNQRRKSATILVFINKILISLIIISIYVSNDTYFNIYVSLVLITFCFIIYYKKNKYTIE